MADTSFRREAKLRHRGVGREGFVEISPKSLVEAFGQPTDESWDTESLGGFYFVSSEDRPFTVYYRAYDRSAAAINRLRESFWMQETPHEFSIGALGQEGVAEFKVWLLSKVAK